MALTGVAAISLGTNGQADAATVGESVTVDYKDGQSIATWSNYHTASVTGSAKDGSTWTVLNTAYDASGAKWYKIGDHKWIFSKYTTDSTTISAASTTASTSSYSTNNNTNTNANSSAASKNYGYSYNYNSTTSPSASTGYSYSASSASTSSTTNSSSTTSSTTSSSSAEEAAKAWIANKESGSSYTASNGNYYGKYQLSLSYLNGDTSAANQEKVANSYVLSRYGSWTAAKAFWLANGWY